VPAGNTFAEFVNNLYEAEIISGYACGGAGEPCDANNRPYYRPGLLVTRAQMTKFVDLARQKPGILLNATAAEGDYYALGAFRNTPGVGGPLDGNGAIFAINSGNGPSGTEPNAGIYASGSGASNSVGIRAVSNTGQGGYFDTGTPASDYGIFIENGGLQVGTTNDGNNDVDIYGDLFVDGTCTGCGQSDVMLNSGASDLHPGDVVAMTGGAAGPAQVGDMPAVAVASADAPYSTGVVGVVSMRWVPADPSAEPTSKAAAGHAEEAGAIKPGEYVVVITQGAYPSMRVDASNGPIRAGDLLVSGSTPGVAVKATDKVEAIGAIIGKAMGNLETGTGTIPVMITLK
jgi:hypothetical protein